MKRLFGAGGDPNARFGKLEENAVHVATRQDEEWSRILDPLEGPSVISQKISKLPNFGLGK